MSDPAHLCPGCSFDLRSVSFHTCSTLDPLYEANPDWTMTEVLALARTQAAEHLKSLQQDQAKRIEGGYVPSWRRSRRAPVSAEHDQLDTP